MVYGSVVERWLVVIAADLLSLGAPLMALDRATVLAAAAVTLGVVGGKVQIMIMV